MCIKPEEIRKVVDERLDVKLAKPLSDILLKMNSLKNQTQGVLDNLDRLNGKTDKTIKKLSIAEKKIRGLEDKQLTKYKDCPHTNTINSIKRDASELKTDINVRNEKRKYEKDILYFVTTALAIAVAILTIKSYF